MLHITAANEDMVSRAGVMSCTPQTMLHITAAHVEIISRTVLVSHNVTYIGSPAQCYISLGCGDIIHITDNVTYHGYWFQGPR